jgi:hypothetical protein
MAGKARLLGSHSTIQLRQSGITYGSLRFPPGSNRSYLWKNCAPRPSRRAKTP